MTSYRDEQGANLATVLVEARAMQDLLDLGVTTVDASLLRSQITRWVAMLERVVESPTHAPPTVKTLIAKALGGSSLDVDGGCFSLHDMTQLAVALLPTARLVVRNSERLAPLEKASIDSVARGAVQFA